MSVFFFVSEPSFDLCGSGSASFAVGTATIRCASMSAAIELSHRMRAVLQALARRDVLESQARVELFAEIAAHFRAKVQFPPEATDGIADEQFVRNIVDSLYRSGRGEKRNASATANLIATP